MVFSDSIKGKTVLITGATWGGLGAEAARVIAKYGAKLVIVAGRRQSSLDETIGKIKQETPSANLRSLVIDLASLDSVRDAAKEVNEYTEPIDVLINNAAIMAAPYSRTKDGFEAQFGINYLAPFLFTNLILDRLLASSQGPRVVNVSSSGHQISKIRFADPGFSDGRTYEKWQAYGQSKTAIILFTKELSNRYKSKGLVAFSLHPGVISTNLANHLNLADEFKENFLDADGQPWMSEEALKSLTWKTIPQGAATHIVAAFDPSIVNQSGSYLEDAKVSNETARPYALDDSNAQQLWKLSEDLVKYPELVA
ncbi:NAD(P)-binding protein [Basidiobolus meristosporus CBS 931.73]|uniref:NAD(P)-binding protein n=2 Tax=Basidiobolus meristosporus CBS 931.73 TaxID=1314790 RepID=A0A1Y1VSA0_9FUNG|nr:NAD(P)-binding protein [Basidiobolus meristosporus CBS 931.73]|eukprot:ORX64168.1 NAD(P)-binding protein [Basidiobolus meristosporus CBS 931.73]